MKILQRTVQSAPIVALVILFSISSAAAMKLEVLAVTPSFSPFNAASRTVTVKGIGFTSSTTVSFDGVAAATALVDGRTIVATVPTVASARVTTIDVDDPGNGADDFFPFLYTDEVFYVAPTGSDSNAGTNPASPKLTIGAAFGAASGTSPTEIRVAGGHYVEPQLALPDFTILSCGWAPGFGLRDPDGNVTDIDANGVGWVIRTSGIENWSGIDGCTLRNGLRDGFGGGGIVISADSSVINNNVIAGNMSTIMGGGIYFVASTSYGGRPSFSNNVIIGNRSHNKNGGGIVIYPNYNTQQEVRVNLSGNAIVGNRSVSGRGGGLALSTGSYAGYNTGKLKVSQNFFGYNSAKTGGGLDVSFFTPGDYYDITLDNLLAVGNAAAGAGGGVSLQGVGGIGGKIACSTMAGNSAAPMSGGGLLIGGAVNLSPSFEATDLILWGNAGDDAGGLAFSEVTYSDAGILLPGTGNISEDPAFAGGTLGGHYLRQSDPNEPDSPAVDAGSALASDLSVDHLTTRTDDTPDSGLADMGFHYQTAAGPSADPIAFSRIDPPSGDLNGQDWVLIRGEGFDPGATVSFGGFPATNVLFMNNRRVLAQPAPGPSGLVDVRVTNPDATFAEGSLAYRYVDNTAPVWTTTVGVVSATSDVDECQRSVILDWNEAMDVDSPPVVYEIYRQECQVSTSVTVPCDNFGYIPNAANFQGNTPETTWADLTIPSSGQPKKWIYAVRGRDSASPFTNKEWNFAKRVVEGSAAPGGGEVLPSAVGDSFAWVPGSSEDFDWTGSSGAISYGLYRETDPSGYGNPGTLTPFITLTSVNNDGNGDGVTDTEYTDASIPAPGGVFFYRITAIDSCGNETTSEL
jgi:hypothetical protein